jgi:uncharacterized protein (TIGR03067 family)
MPSAELIMAPSLVAIAGVMMSISIRTAHNTMAELEKLQGTWVGVALTSFGQPVRADFSSWRLVIKGADYTHSLPKSESRFRISRLAPRARPKGFELRDHPDVRRGPSSPPSHFRCVYEIEGDTLRVCFANPDDPLPTKIEMTNPKYLCYEWKREKKK